MTYRGKVRNGVVILDKPVRLPEGTEVSVTLLETQARRGVARKPLPRKGLLAFAGQAKGLPADASRNLKHYLYGHPQQ
jgi:hypothetical protein